MGFYQLLLGHLLGDFIFQTNRIAENKTRRWNWNLLHTVIVSLCMLVFSVSSGLTAILLVLAAGVLHYFVDFFKPKMSEIHKLPEIISFILDQGIHILIIYIISLIVPLKPAFPFMDTNITKFLITMAIVTSFAAILNKYILDLIFPCTRAYFFAAGEKSIGIVVRLLMTLSLYFSLRISFALLTVMPLALSILYCQYKKSWSEWMGLGQLTMKSTLDIIISLTGLAFLIN